MDSQDIRRNYDEKLDRLSDMIGKTERSVIDELAGFELLSENINFFTKSYLISLCAYIELYVKELATAVATDLDNRLRSIAIPSSALLWRIDSKPKSNSVRDISPFLLNVKEKEIDELISGNVFKTRDTFKIFGIDVESDPAKWSGWKDVIQSIVTRRNNIVHHDDQASDLSFGDLREYVEQTRDYFSFLHGCIDNANRTSALTPAPLQIQPA